MAVVHEAVVTLSVEVWVMCGNLRKVRIRRATEGLRENEVEHHVGNGSNAFCLVHGGGGLEVRGWCWRVRGKGGNGHLENRVKG